MKKSKLFALTLASVILASLSTTVFAAEPTTLYSTKGTAAVDGLKDAVYSAPGAYIGVTNDGAASASTTAYVYSAWDESYMYYFIDVTDAAVTEEGSTSNCNSDSVEIYFSFENEDGDINTMVGSGQYTYGPGFTAWAGVGGHRELYLDNAKAAYAITEKGYTVEMAIPVGDDYELKDGLTIPFCAMVNDSLAAGTPDLQYTITPGQGDAWEKVEVAVWDKICFTTTAPAAETAEPEEAPAPAETEAVEVPAAEETVEAPAPTTAPAPETAPQTLDPLTLAAVTSAVALAGCAVTKKKR